VYLSVYNLAVLLTVRNFILLHGRPWLLILMVFGKDPTF